MAPHILAGYLALALSTLAIVFVLRQQAPRWLLQPRFSATSSADDYVRQLYLHTVKHSVTGILLQTPGYGNFGPKSKLKEEPYDHDKRMVGGDWPAIGLTMAGVARMDNIEDLWGRVLAANTPGDFVETGVWRGGSSIFARAVLAAHSIKDRKVHLVDSFNGLPKATTKEDSDRWAGMDYLQVSEAEVRASFRRYSLLDDQVAFYKGFFRYSMPVFRDQYTGPIAILRMDGDMYESTMDVLYNAYDRVPVGGYVIVDDWSVAECRKAVHEFFEMHGGEEEVHKVDWTAVWWQKTRAAPLQHKWYQDFNASRGSET